MANTRYSDKDLAEFRDILEQRLIKEKKNLDYYTNALKNRDDNDINDTAPAFKGLEDGNSTLMKEENAYHAQKTSDYIKKLEQALVRIENKTYGICVITGELIPKDRLRAVPTTTKTIDAKKSQK
jgi:RNA polymerase-binding transcription factor DksA